MNLRTRKRAGGVIVALAMAGALLAPTPAFAAPPISAPPVALERGHIDAFYTILNDDESVTLALSDDATASHLNRTPESVELVVKDGASPAGARQSWATTSGALVPAALKTGNPVWRLPANQNQNIIWPGWDTNSLVPVYGANVSVDFAISVAGPGDVFIWQQNEDGDLVSLLADGGHQLSPSGSIRQPYAAHSHANWAFTQPGTYTFTTTAHVSGNGKTATSNTAVYTFIVAPGVEITGVAPSYADGAAIALTASSPVQNGRYEWRVDGVLVEGQTGSQLSLTATQSLNGQVVTAKLFGAVGTEIATAPGVTLNVAAPVQTLAITGLSAHYHQGSPIVLNASATLPVAEGSSYEWFLQRRDHSAPVKVAGQSGSTLSLTAEQALDNAVVTANLVDEHGDVLAAAAAVTIDIDDHGAPAFNAVTISGLADHYHTGSTATLTAEVSPASVLSRYEWQLRAAGASDWTVVPGQNGASYSFTVTEELEDAEVRAALTYDDGVQYVVSAPVTIEIDDHHGEEPVETVLTIAGLADHYHTGGSLSLTAVQTPPTGEDHYHWFIKRSGSDTYEVIPAQATGTLTYTIAAGDNGAQVIVRLYDHDHGVIAESAPVTVVVNDHGHGDDDDDHGDEKPATPSTEPAETVADGTPAGGIALDKGSVGQGGTVVITVGEEHAGEWIAAWLFSTPVLLGTDWLLVAPNGTVTVHIPATAAAGDHRVVVFDAAGALVGWQPLAVTAAGAGTGTGDGLSKTGSELSPLALGGASLLLLAGGATLVAARRRRAELAN